MAYTIANGPRVMSCSADPIVTVDVQFIYDDAEASVKNVHVAIDDIIRVKYMGGEYSPVVLEAEGRLHRFSVLKDKNGQIFSSTQINDTLGQVKSFELDCSIENRREIISIPVAAIRELENLSASGLDNDDEVVKPDCEHPGAYCPNNPGCTCPGYVQPVVDCPCQEEEKEIDIDGDGIPDVIIDDSGITQTQLIEWRAAGYKCVFKGKPYRDLQEAINNVVCPCVDMILDAIILIDNIDNDDKMVNYTIPGPCIIRSLSGMGKKQYYIEGSFTVNSTEKVVFYNLLIVHKGVGKEAIAIDAVNASLTVKKCTFVFDNKTFAITDNTVELPMAIRCTRVDNDKRGYEDVLIEDNEFANYPEVSINNGETLSTCILFTRNFGDLYGDFKYAVGNNRVPEISLCTSAPHILFVDQNFNGETDVSKLECSGVVCSEEGLKEILQYQGLNTYIDIAGIVDLDNEQFSITVSNESKLRVSGLLNLGNNNLNNFGTVCNAGVITGGVIINNGKVTYCADKFQRHVGFYNTKIRANGSQKILKCLSLENECDFE